jgi:hypothetical protein
MSQLGGLAVITLADVAARVRRLDELTRGLAKEVVLWKEANDPLLYLERRAYLEAIQTALKGVDDARVVLARARQRLGAQGAAPDGQPGKAEEENLGGKSHPRPG